MAPRGAEPPAQLPVVEQSAHCLRDRVGGRGRAHKYGGAHAPPHGGDGRGIRTDDLLESIPQHYKNHEDIPKPTNPNRSLATRESDTMTRRNLRHALR